MDIRKELAERLREPLDAQIVDEYCPVINFILSKQCLELLKDRYEVRSVGFNLLNNSTVVVK